MIADFIGILRHGTGMAGVEGRNGRVHVGDRLGALGAKGVVDFDCMKGV